MLCLSLTCVCRTSWWECTLWSLEGQTVSIWTPTCGRTQTGGTVWRARWRGFCLWCPVKYLRPSSAWSLLTAFWWCDSPSAAFAFSGARPSWVVLCCGPWARFWPLFLCCLPRPAGTSTVRQASVSLCPSRGKTFQVMTTPLLWWSSSTSSSSYWLQLASSSSICLSVVSPWQRQRTVTGGAKT